MTANQSSEDVNNSDNIFNESRISTVLWAFRMHNFRMASLRSFVKCIRKKLNLNKSPKNKGYGQFFTEEEKRYYASKIFFIDKFMIGRKNSAILESIDYIFSIIT